MWDDPLIWTHVGADSLTGIAYFFIAGLLIYFVAKKKSDIPFHWMFLLFGAFIFSCGVTHFMSVWTVYFPSYWEAGSLKVINAVISIATAIILIPLFPKILALPGLQKSLDDNIRLTEELKESSNNFRHSLHGTIDVVSKAVEARDPYVSGHQKRVADLACAIAREMGMNKNQIEGIRLGATIHDIGKIQIPAEILSKPSKLDDMEYRMIMTHSTVGYDILKDINFPWPIANIAHQHHERMDGSGYPQGLKGEEICLEARIVAVADVVEAINSHRPYRAALGLETALDELQINRGKYYDPMVVDSCLKIFKTKMFEFEKGALFF